MRPFVVIYESGGKTLVHFNTLAFDSEDARAQAQTFFASAEAEALFEGEPPEFDIRNVPDVVIRVEEFEEWTRQREAQKEK